MKKLFPWAFFVFLTLGILFPNPFGNNPDVILDESYFLSSSLAAIQGHTLPGWVWSPSTTYYGGPQTYVDTAALVPVLGVVVATSHFSITKAEFWVAQNTGFLLQVLRLVNGISALVAIVFCFLYFKKRKVPPEFAGSLMLFLFLVLSNVLVIEFLHTAKMWSFYIIFVAVASAFFLAQEYYARYLDKPFLKKETYAALLIWSAVLTFFQNYLGIFSILLLIVYAILLGHIAISDLWKHVRRYWYLIILFSLTQVSFLYQAYLVSHQLSDASIKTATGAVDWSARILMPLYYAVSGQPLSLLYVIGALAVVVLAFSRRAYFADKRKRMMLIIACMHPILVYVFFYLIIGLDLLPRYGIVLTIACSFAAVMLMSELGSKWVKAALVCGMLLFVVIDVHAISLYWQPSSETVLLQTIEAKYNTPSNVFITDHSARRMTLPVNYASLSFLDTQRADMSRYSFLLQHENLLSADDSFKPIVMTAYVDSEEAADIARFATTTDAVWTISSDCTDLCSAAETTAGTCFEIHVDTCDILPQEVNTLPDFLRASELGYPYTVRRVH